MKRIIIATIAVLLLLTACATQAPEPSSEQPAVEEPVPAEAPEEPTPSEEPAAEEPEAPRPVREVEEAPEEPAPEPSKPIPLYGATPIGATEDTKPIQIADYELDRTENTATLKLVRFTIRNFGDGPIRPRVVMQLTGEGFAVNKIWDYDRLLNGHKFEKDVKLTIELDAPKLMKIMQLTLLDMDKGMEELGSDKKQFIPIPPKK
jgi:hypothetical protein